ncbi:MAG: hypothetical protein Q9160_000244 [Pyrenula sp. 1 TL-2023]
MSLNEAIKARGKLYFGTATEQSRLNNPSDAAIVRAGFGQVTPEYTMKWSTIEPSQGSFDFSLSDALVNWGQSNGKLIRGHTLVWHEDLPDWVQAITDKATLTSVIQKHVSTVVGHFKGRVRSWDVVNEIIDDSGNGNLRDSVFSRVLGEDFVRIAFEAANRADPSAKLYINDYSLDGPTWAKVPVIVSKVSGWRAAGVPIHGIGSQTHLNTKSQVDVGAALSKLASTGVDEVAITELDVEGSGPEEYYKNAVSGCLNQPKCIGITVWGIADSEYWKAGATPLLFDGSYNPKPAYTAVANLLQ